MKHHFFSACVLILSISLKAQEPSKLSTFYSIGRLNATGSFGGIGTVMAPNGNSLEGDEYYDSPDFKKGFISVNGFEKPFGEFQIRYNIRSQEIEMLQGEKVISLSPEKIRSVMYELPSGEKHFFFNAKGYISKGVSMTGFFEVLTEGRVLLLKRKTFEHKKTSFNPLDVESSTTEKLLKKEQFFLLNLLKDGGNELTELPRQKGKIMDYLGNKNEVTMFFKANNLSLRSESDLISLINFSNGLN